MDKDSEDILKNNILNSTVLKIKVIYCHLWFHEQPLTSMEPYYWTKGSLWWKKKVLLIITFLFTSIKKKLFLELFTKGKPKMVLLWHRCENRSLETFIFKSVGKKVTQVWNVTTVNKL